MDGIKEEKMKYTLIKNIKITTKLILEEYIPLKIIFNEQKEGVKYISYSKGKKSHLEIVIGMQSCFIKKITLLLSEKYNFFQKKLIIEESKVTVGNLDIEIDSLVEKIECSNFFTYLFLNGVKIILSDEKSITFVKIDKVYIGISKSNEIVEICIIGLKEEEIYHIKNELDLQIL